jgi:hypothetical protein
VAAIIALPMAAMLAVGCGGGSDANEPEASRSFFTKGDENKIPKFGEEADEEEREAASAVLSENLTARASGDWAKQCATLAKGAVEEVEEGAAAQGLKGGGCAKELESRAQPLSQTKSIRANPMTGPIDALRVKGDRGYALFHGTEGNDYFVPMENVDGEWKVDSIFTEVL